MKAKILNASDYMDCYANWTSDNFKREFLRHVDTYARSTRRR